ncbi:MAG TPA: glycoside hydrolase [Paenibacillaceae bacterium]|nr:glycoside hydrolase [Paenibacillaceae bacterium]
MNNKWKPIYMIFFLLLFYLEPTVALGQNRFNMTYLYFGRTDQYVEFVDNARRSVGTISPNYFEINDDGSLKMTAKYNKQFVDEMHRRGIKVVPFISNHWDRALGRVALGHRVNLSTQIANAIRDMNLDGVDVDIENLTEVDRDANTDFMALLRSKIPITKEVSIAVAPNPYDWKNGWQGSYDYPRLAQVLTGSRDYLMIMAYDESWEGSDPGPVASLPFVDKSIQYAINKGVPRSKIVLGLPFYGRFWKTDGTLKGVGISHWQVYDLMDRYQGTVTMDSSSQTPRFDFTIGPGDPPSTIAYKTLTTGNYTVWFDNEASLKKKLDVVRKYNIKGTGNWSLSQEEDSMWDYYSLWLNGLFFSDIQSHWAKSYIQTVQGKGWMVGVSSSRFAPDSPLTRAQGATILVRALGLENASPKTSFPFRDVSSSHWARKYIHLAKEKGIISGMSETSFAPDTPLTREQMAKMLNNLMQYSNSALPSSPPYADVSPDRWSYQVIVNLSQRKIFSGVSTSAGLFFKPTGRTTRAEMATLMSRMATDIESLIY